MSLTAYFFQDLDLMSKNRSGIKEADKVGHRQHNEYYYHSSGLIKPPE
jgi:hypothetical protein